MVDVAELKKSEFWKKKFRRAVESRDTDKNGSITRSDFELVVESYKKSAGGTTDKIEKMSKLMSSFCDKLELSDSVVLSYEEFEQRWQAIICYSRVCLYVLMSIVMILSISMNGKCIMLLWVYHQDMLRILLMPWTKMGMRR